MRVIGGTARGRRLRVPAGHDVRPTGDRVREALFSILEPDLHGAVVLDGYAGSGALGIEALSRGAAHAVLVERDRRAATAIRENLAATGLGERARLHPADVRRFARAPRGGPFDLVLLDPPYAEPLAGLVALLEDLRAAGGLTPGARIVVERDRRDPDLDAPLPGWLAREGPRTYGDTVLLLLRAGEVEEMDP